MSGAEIADHKRMCISFISLILPEQLQYKLKKRVKTARSTFTPYYPRSLRYSHFSLIRGKKKLLKKLTRMQRVISLITPINSHQDKAVKIACTLYKN